MSGLAGRTQVDISINLFIASLLGISLMIGAGDSSLYSDGRSDSLSTMNHVRSALERGVESLYHVSYAVRRDQVKRSKHLGNLLRMPQETEICSNTFMDTF